jgi:poly(hydroxyalkanoate) granule-associated protein
MAKKTTRKATLKDSAHQIWLAGLGAFAAAGSEGGRLFKSLVKKGETVDRMNKKRLGEVLERAERVQGNARQTLTRLARPIERGMDNAMNRLGVPSRKEIQLLTRRVEELTRVVQKRTRAGGRTRKPRPAAPVAG